MFLSVQNIFENCRRRRYLYVSNYLCVTFKFIQKWKNETKYYLFSNEIHNSEYYQAIIKLGKDVLPFIFAELQKESGHWFYALKQITNENPLKESSKGILNQ